MKRVLVIFELLASLCILKSDGLGFVICVGVEFSEFSYFTLLTKKGTRRFEIIC